MEDQLGRRRFAIGVTAVCTAGILFWIALHCDGSDWYISQNNADVIYTGILRFREFPFFSWVFNGGSYFLQDPQSNLFSFVTPLILSAGPTLGLRLAEGLWGALGVLAFTGWMSRRVSTEAALVGAVAGALSLGVLWRIAVGNDMFLWHLGLPFLLWAVERVMSERTWESALWFGLALGLLLLGPTFHSFTYLFVPVVPLFVLVEWAFTRPPPKVVARTVGLFGLACMLGLAMMSFKLVSWLAFPMVRRVKDPGTIPLWSAITQLFDYSVVKEQVVVPTRFIARAGWAIAHQKGWGVEESATALPPIASLFALVGLGYGFYAKRHRKTAVFAVLLLFFGLTLTSWSPAWEAFRALNGGNFRVAQRCLGMASFGLSVTAALGVEFLLVRLRRWQLPTAAGLIACCFASALWWVHAASKFNGETANDAVQPTAIHPLARAREEREALAKLVSFDQLRPFRNGRDLLDGYGYTDGFIIVGNAYDSRRYAPARRRKRKAEPADRLLPFIYGDTARPEQVSVAHLRIRLRDLAGHARVVLRARNPDFGVSVKTVPPDAPVTVAALGQDMLVIENHGDAPVQRVVVRALLPVSAAWFVLSGLALVGVPLTLLWFGLDRRRRNQLAPANNLSETLV